MRLIDADELSKVKFHPLPYTHIVPADLLKAQTEAYERGWNDAIDAIIENAETIEPQQKKGKWVRENIVLTSNPPQYRWHCSECGKSILGFTAAILTDYCPNCGADMKGEQDESS